MTKIVVFISVIFLAIASDLNVACQMNAICFPLENET